MKINDLSRPLTYRNGVIKKHFGQETIFNRKEFLNMVQQNILMEENTLQQISGHEGQVENMKTNLKMIRKDVKEMTELRDLFIADFEKEAFSDVKECLEQHKYFTFTDGYNKDWTPEDEQFKVFENERTKILYDVHIDKKLSDKYPDYMIKKTVWSDEFNPSKK